MVASGNASVFGLRSQGLLTTVRIGANNSIHIYSRQLSTAMKEQLTNVRIGFLRYIFFPKWIIII